MTTGQVTLNSSTPTLILNLADRRDTVALVASGDCYIGNSNVTATTGFRLVANLPEYINPGNPLYTSAQGSVYGISATGTPTVTFEDMANQTKA